MSRRSTLDAVAPEIQQPLVGGSLSLDLMNTTWQQGQASFDWLDDPLAVVEFSARNGQSIELGDVDATRSALVAMRDLIGRLLVADDGVSAALRADVDRALATTIVSFDPDASAVKVAGAHDSDHVAVAALLDVIELLADRPDRVRTCDHDGCSLWFVDTSKAGRRRWCSMQACGNRTKSKRHYDKRSANE